MALSTSEVLLLLRAQDLSSSVIAKVRGEVEGLGDAGTAASGKLATAAGALGTLGTTLATVGVAGIAAGLGTAITAATTFEHQLSAIAAVSSTAEVAAVGGMKAIGDAALQLGKDTSFSATESAAGMEEMVKAGVSLTDVLGGGAKATLDLAAAGSLSVAEAATVASNAMNAFALAGKDLPHIADELAGASVASATDVHQLGFALASVGAVAHTIGVSFDDTTTAISLLAQAGLKGSDSGTSLKTMLLGLSPSTKPAIAAMKELGIITADGSNQFFDARGNVKSMADIAGVLQRATAKLTKEQKINALQTIFGTDAIRAAAILSEQGAEGINKMAAAEGAAGGASAIANTRLDNLSGSLEKLKGSVETAAITLGLALTPALKSLVDAATDLLNRALPPLETFAKAVSQQIPGALAALQSAGETALAWIGRIPAPVQAAIVAFLGILTAAGPLGVALRALGLVLGLLAAPLLALATPLGILAAAVAAFAAIWAANLGNVQERARFLLAMLGPLFSKLVDIVVQALGGDLVGAFARFTALLSETGAKIGPILTIWGQEFALWAPGAIAALLAGGADLAARLLGWLGEQVAAIPWATVWSRAVDVVSGMATWFLTLSASLISWIGLQVGMIPWAQVWAMAIDVVSSMALWFVGLSLQLALWIGAEVALIDWVAVWANATGLAAAMQAALEAQAATINWPAVIQANHDAAAQMAIGINEMVAAGDWKSVGETFTQVLFAGNGPIAVGLRAGWALLNVAYAILEPLATIIIGLDWTVVRQQLIMAWFGVISESWRQSIALWRPIMPAIVVDFTAFVNYLSATLRNALQAAWNAAVRAVSFALPAIGSAPRAPATTTYYRPNPAAQYAQGTNYVPDDQLAFLHKGEAVIPAAMNTGQGAPATPVTQAPAASWSGGGAVSISVVVADGAVRNVVTGTGAVGAMSAGASEQLGDRLGQGILQTIQGVLRDAFEMSGDPVPGTAGGAF